ncbi:MAG: class I SAM-dependent methyltransferase [Calditrichaeota bacterium]|nr:MAG: class I SAM-dependent methyltransferase [Calditrichota bacterium]
MKLLCPECRTKIDFEKLFCQNGHKFFFDEDVLILLENNFSSKLNSFLKTLEKIRFKENRVVSISNLFQKLPFVLQSEIEWKVRCFDLEVLEKFLPNENLKILEIGAWNGWLSNFLAEKKHSVTAVDYFLNEFDGLKAKKFYSNDWTSIQMNLMDLDLFEEKFDLIIFNRCLQFSPNPFSMFETATNLLSEKGKVFVSGISVFKNANSKINEIERFKENYRREWVFEIFLNPTKGFFDVEDKIRFEKIGLEFEKYPQLFKQNLKATFVSELPKHYYGIFRK